MPRFDLDSIHIHGLRRLRNIVIQNPPKKRPRGRFGKGNLRRSYRGRWRLEGQPARGGPENAITNEITSKRLLKQTKPQTALATQMQSNMPNLKQNHTNSCNIRQRFGQSFRFILSRRFVRKKEVRCVFWGRDLKGEHCKGAAHIGHSSYHGRFALLPCDEPPQPAQRKNIDIW